MTISRILIPVDGSEHANCALAPAHRLLSGRQGTVTLMRVVGKKDHEDRKPLDEARNLLFNMRRPSSGEEIKIKVEHMRGDPAAEIVSQARLTRPDLVAMATHGRTGLSRLIRGSVAETVLRECPVPLLLCTSSGSHMAGPNAPYHRILVPLDGSEIADGILDLVTEVARSNESEVLLLRVCDEPLESGTRTYAEIAGFLGHYAKLFESRGLRKVQMLGATGEPAEQILGAIQEHRVDLVAMSTHGRTGSERLRFGSVAEEVLRKCACPLLIRRVTDWKRVEAVAPD